MPKHISCTATSVQLGHKRFPDRHERPRVKGWRCDLTALSRSHNFYFVACNDTIHVYEPRFPSQNIPGEPELILHPPTSSPNLQFGIDPEDSHSITRLHVDYLGQDEIILITCDDGDVIGYRTEEIQRVVNKKREESDGETESQIEEPVKTFLHRNVGSSAWGLAIHREARMIAISANTQKVTVIAYALAQQMDFSDNSSLSSDSELDGCSDREDVKDFPSPRRQDHIITLSARHNVPSVSFNNNIDDRSGRWLSSCSINGETLIWDLHNPQKSARTIRIGFCASVRDPLKAPKHSPGACACLRPSNVPHAVWNTMFLDAETAFEDSSVQDLSLPLDHPLPYIQDVSDCKTQFAIRPSMNSLAMVDPVNEALFDNVTNEMEISETESTYSDDGGASSPMSSRSTSVGQLDRLEDVEMELDVSAAVPDASQPVQEPAEIEDPTSVPIAVEETSHGTPNLHPAPPQTGNHPINPFGPSYGPSSQPPGQNSTTIVWDDEDEDDDGDDDDSGSGDELFVPSHAHIYMACHNAFQPARAYCEVITAFTLARQPRITSPFLIVTKEDVHLYQRPLDYVGDHSDPIITIRQPLHPEKTQSPFPFIPGSHDRHCYTTQIPELGVFIVASPNGRAGIFSLTKSAQKPQGRPLYSFQLEYVLPFANDDKSKIWDVEGARLIGVAVGPVQGTLDRFDGANGENGQRVGDGGPGARRWRVMMYFMDHTVLAFELAKRREGEVPGVGELVV
ncbi:hypothetical protein OPT61_g9573 [Boeremia exigua]|uniref:Uncharacterized protein n=1 Tax=Boeremia exigua TaxID=749465 RepID=A0ACC2HU58_9PLEO|nr:hypothetical protein OPT61_g9573 [Boeremia exigua]